MNNFFEVKKRIALFGGTFNPIHNAHINIMINTLQLKLVDEIWIMPSYNPYHKENIESLILNYEDRVKLIDIVIKSLKDYTGKIKLSNVEKDLYEKSIINKSYTSIVFDYIKEEYKNYDFCFLLGSDSIYALDTWYDYTNFIKKASFIIYPRDNDINKLLNKINSLNLKYYIIDNAIYDISSTKIRNLLINKKYNEIDKYLIKEELEYILKNKLYE